jgi:MFS family permease
LTGVLISSTLSLFSLLSFGRLSDGYGSRRVYLAGAVGSALFSIPYCCIMGSGSAVAIWVAMMIGMTGHDRMYAAVRYRGARLGDQPVSLVAGGSRR